MRRSGSTALALVLAGCLPSGGGGGGSGGGGGDADLRPEGSPDYLVLGVSGHCFGFACPSEPYSPEYLEEQGTLGAIAGVVAADGNDVQYVSYGDSFWSYTTADGWDPPVRGFLELVEDLHWVYENWIDGFSNPTVVIVVAHSHGTVWSHTALHLVPEVPVLLLVDLDGESLGWESDSWTLDTLGDDWAYVASRFYEQNRSDWPLSVFWQWDIWDASDAWDIPGVARPQDVEDVVPFNVGVNIETAGNGNLFGVHDSEPNHRPDGGQENIFRFESEEDEHEECDDLGSETMEWLLQLLWQVDWQEIREEIDG